MIFTPNSEQKDIALGHFLYRVWQLMGASQLATLQLPDDASMDDKIRHNALVESFLIHSRALFEFFKTDTDPQKRHKKDVLVKDFPGFNALEVSISSNHKDRLDKDLAHFTYSENITEEQKRWHHKELVYPILVRVKEFIEYLLQNYPLTPKRRSQCKERLEQIDEYFRVVR